MCDIDHYPNLNDFRIISFKEFMARRHNLSKMGTSNDFIGPKGQRVQVDWHLFCDRKTEEYVRLLQQRPA